MKAVSKIKITNGAEVESILMYTKPAIVIAQKDQKVVLLLTAILKKDYRVFAADDGSKALELINKILPALVICDVLLPEINGIEVCNRSKNSPLTYQIPFILLSAQRNEMGFMEGYEVGADAYITKPVDTDYLKLRIKNLLATRQRMLAHFKNNLPSGNFKENDGKQADKEFIDKLVTIIEQNKDIASLTADSLQQALCVTKMQLYRKMKMIAALTPNEFINQLRLKTAASLLSTTGLTVSQIFFRTGFNNQSYFFREFKKQYHCAPIEFRTHNTA